MGGDYSGWQKQLAPVVSTVQNILEQALSKIANHEVTVSCAGRTDSGVHATCQVVHFDCKTDRGEKAWVVGCNSLLPCAVRVIWAKAVKENFHARFSALSRRYQYLILEGRVQSAILAARVTQNVGALEVEGMNEGAQYLLGEQNFSSFRAAGCQSNSPNRKVMTVSVSRKGNYVVLDISANAFLQHMVRNIAGSLILIGRGEKKADWIKQLIAARDRTLAAMTAPSDGLYLVAVAYPQEYELPSSMINCPLLNASMG